ncbi:hypothetical protein DL96DRAFT_389064 [Flagelloscypha sp. PMI_526]|nr:hypothetical protein DL96DRAFT_389064 [Flagelloscypha sp. PMI_526]
MHMIASAASDELLLLYEYSFGFPAPRSLCVHSKWNLALGHIGLRRTLDAHDALLLPSLPDLQYISNCLRDIRVHRKNESEPGQLPHHLSWETIRHCGREDGAQVHLYRFIPFGFSYHKLPDTPPAAPMFRYNAMTKQYQQHAYPYSTLPALQSHLSPFMVIANGFDKYRRWLLSPEKLPDGPNFLARATNQGLLDDPDTKACFEVMLDIFEALELLDLARRQNSRWHPITVHPTGQKSTVVNKSCMIMYDHA